MPPVRGKYIAVEGPIGVGKTAVVQALSKRLGAKIFLDPPNPFLGSFYQDMEKFALQVQLYFLLSRFQQQKDLAQGDLFNHTVVCDYLFQKDRLFASLTLDAQEYSLYEKIYSLLHGTIATPDVVIYLQADVETLLDRIAHKDEGLSLLLPETYLEELVSAYQTFFYHYTDAPVIVVNTESGELAGNEDALDRLVAKLGDVTTGIHYLNSEGRS